METIRLTYRVTTPMFLGGANQRAELRAASFKGALRFWWRSLQAARFGNDVAALRQQEAELFGTSDQEIGRSRVRLRMVRSDLKLEKKGQVLWADEVRGGGKSKGNQRRGGAFYLAYGAVNSFYSAKSNSLAGQLDRDCFLPGTFTLQVTLDRGLHDQQRQSVRDALRLIGTVGCLGSCSRRGYGSLSLVSGQRRNEGDWIDDPDWQATTVEQTLEALVATHAASDLPEWSAWSVHSRAVSLTSNGNERDLLDDIGRELVQYRGWGNNGTVLGRERERNFQADHDLYKNASRGERNPLPKGFDQPLRIAFGLPHNYGKRSNEHVEPADTVNGKKLDRRASPLFIHVHQPDPTQSPIGLVFSLPARFLPENQGRPPRVRVFGSNVNLNKAADFWNPINGFLDRIAGKADAGNPCSGTEQSTELNGQEIELPTAGATA